MQMKVVIIGAGNVGYISAEALSKVHEVLIVERDQGKVDNAKSLNVSVLHEDGSNPNILKSAIEKINADIIMSAVPDDSINIFICLMSKRIKPSITTVACLRDPDYIIKTSSEGVEGIDILISPELITAEMIVNLATLENVVEYDNIRSMNLALATFKVERHHDIVGRIVMNTRMPENCNIVCIYRGNGVVLECETAEIHAEDRICVLGSADAIHAFNRMIGIDREAKEFMILGASAVGIEVARSLLKVDRKVFVKIIEKDEALCRNAIKELNGPLIVNGDFNDPLILKSENIQRTDVVISVSSMDERNLLACMAALKFGSKKIVSRYSTREYEEIFKHTGIESIIGYHRVIFNEVTKSLVYDENAILARDHEGEFFFSVTLNDTSTLTNSRPGDLRLPEGVRIAAIHRDGRTIYPRMDTVFLSGDKVLLFTHMANPVGVTKFLGQRIPLGY